MKTDLDVYYTNRRITASLRGVYHRAFIRQCVRACRRMLAAWVAEYRGRARYCGTSTPAGKSSGSSE